MSYLLLGLHSSFYFLKATCFNLSYEIIQSDRKFSHQKNRIDNFIVDTHLSNFLSFLSLEKNILPQLWSTFSSSYSASEETVDAKQINEERDRRRMQPRSSVSGCAWLAKWNGDAISRKVFASSSSKLQS